MSRIAVPLPGIGVTPKSKNILEKKQSNIARPRRDYLDDQVAEEMEKYRNVSACYGKELVSRSPEIMFLGQKEFDSRRSSSILTSEIDIENISDEELPRSPDNEDIGVRFSAMKVRYTMDMLENVGRGKSTLGNDERSSRNSHFLKKHEGRLSSHPPMPRPYILPDKASCSVQKVVNSPMIANIRAPPTRRSGGREQEFKDQKNVDLRMIRRNRRKDVNRDQDTLVENSSEARGKEPTKSRNSENDETKRNSFLECSTQNNIEQSEVSLVFPVPQEDDKKQFDSNEIRLKDLNYKTKLFQEHCSSPPKLHKKLLAPRSSSPLVTKRENDQSKTVLPKKMIVSHSSSPTCQAKKSFLQRLSPPPPPPPISKRMKEIQSRQKLSSKPDPKLNLSRSPPPPPPPLSVSARNSRPPPPPPARKTFNVHHIKNLLKQEDNLQERRQSTEKKKKKKHKKKKSEDSFDLEDLVGGNLKKKNVPPPPPPTGKRPPSAKNGKRVKNRGLLEGIDISQLERDLKECEVPKVKNRTGSYEYQEDSYGEFSEPDTGKRSVLEDDWEIVSYTSTQSLNLRLKMDVLSPSAKRFT